MHLAPSPRLRPHSVSMRSARLGCGFRLNLTIHGFRHVLGAAPVHVISGMRFRGRDHALGAAPAHGTPAIGASPATTSLQKSNLAVATGVLHRGSSRTLAIEWVYGPEGQPDIRNSILILRAWLRFFDESDVPITALE